MTAIRKSKSQKAKIKKSGLATFLKIPSLFAFCLLTFSSSVHAISSNAGTSNGDFLKIPTDARGVALGPSIVSMAEGEEGMRWNPAALGRTDSQELDATHILYYQDVSVENVGYAYPLEDGAIAVNAFYLSPGSLDGRDLFGNPTGNFNFYDLVGAIGYGRRLMSSDDGTAVYVGGELKIVQEQIDNSQYQNPAADLGLLVIPFENLRAGLAARNLSTGGANFPKELTGGASYTLFHVLTGAFSLRYADDAPWRFNVGGEYKFPELDNAVLRAGYQTHDPLDDSVDSGIPAFHSASMAGLTLGAGMEYRPPMFKTLRLQLDYAMAPFGALGISHTITVKVKW